MAVTLIDLFSIWTICGMIKANICSLALNIGRTHFVLLSDTENLIMGVFEELCWDWPAVWPSFRLKFIQEWLIAVAGQCEAMPEGHKTYCHRNIFTGIGHNCHRNIFTGIGHNWLQSGTLYGELLLINKICTVIFSLYSKWNYFNSIFFKDIYS